MFRFHPMFWILAVLFFVFASRRRRWHRRWAMAGPMGYARDAEWPQRPPAAATPQPLAQPDRTLVEALETRIAELETRLEFAERLMSKKAE